MHACLCCLLQKFADHKLLAKRALDSTGVLSSVGGICSAAPLVYFEDGGGSYYLTNPALKWVIESNGGTFQSGLANSKTRVVVLGDTDKETANGGDTWTGCKKQIAIKEQQQLAADGKRAPLQVLSLTGFAEKYDLEDDIEPELLWAFTNSYNKPLPEERMKNFLGIGNTCVVSGEYEKSLGIKNGYSRGRYCVHIHGQWPDASTLLEMNQRYFKEKKPKENKAPKHVVD